MKVIRQIIMWINSMAIICMTHDVDIMELGMVWQHLSMVEIEKSSLE